MSLIEAMPRRSAQPSAVPNTAIHFARQSIGVGEEANTMLQSFMQFGKQATADTNAKSSIQLSLTEKLYYRLEQYKVLTSKVAMHLSDNWRSLLFRQLDMLLELDEWPEGDPPPTVASFRTFLRLVLWLKTDVPPGLGASIDGNIIAAWTHGNDRLTIECLESDQVRWSIVHTVDETLERAAGFTVVSRIFEVLGPYSPEKWFKRVEQVHSSGR